VEEAAAQPGAETLRGRGRVHVVPAPVGSGKWVVRHYHRGGAVASLLGDRYLRVGTPRPFHEFRLGRTLETWGVPVAPHVGAAVYGSGIWYRGDLVTELVPDARDLAAVLFPDRSLEGAASCPGGDAGKGAVGGPVDAEGAMRAAGSLIRLLHERGVVHRDLNLKNILIVGGGSGSGPEDGAGGTLRALVLDLDRATLKADLGEGARRRMLARFWRSARKWETRTGIRVEPRLRRAFERGYGQRGDRGIRGGGGAGGQGDGGGGPRGGRGPRERC
ncbi:MAG: lipopolysaccharide kinase InaA family protein, partial [Gemmatimonadota bacterium]